MMGSPNGVPQLECIAAVFDVRARKYMTPFFSTNSDVARREFERLQRDEQSVVCAFPADYELRWLGNFSPGTGRIDCFAEPHVLIAAAQPPVVKLERAS